MVLSPLSSPSGQREEEEILYFAAHDCSDTAWNRTCQSEVPDVHEVPFPDPSQQM